MPIIDNPEDIKKPKGIKKKMSKPKKAKAPGREKGSKILNVKMFSRYSLCWYSTIKKANDDGTERITGRDYSASPDIWAKRQKDFTRKQDTQMTTLLKSVKRYKYKEDCVKNLPFLIVEKAYNPRDYDWSFFPEDKPCSIIVDKKETMSALENLVGMTFNKLNEMGRKDIAKGLKAEWDKMMTDDVPPAKSKSPEEIQKEQLDLFSW
jgi:hypothetical protein